MKKIAAAAISTIVLALSLRKQRKIVFSRAYKDSADEPTGYILP